jgi:hypothetical protein
VHDHAIVKAQAEPVAAQAPSAPENCQQKSATARNAGSQSGAAGLIRVSTIGARHLAQGWVPISLGAP